MSDEEEEIGRVYCSGMVFEWTVPMSNLEENDGKFYSPDFECFENDWYFGIWGNFISNEDKIKIRLRRHNCSSMPSVWFTVGLKTAMGMEILFDGCMLNTLYSSSGRNLLKSDLLRRRCELAPLDTLTFICALEDKPPSSEGRSFVSIETQTEDLTDDAAGEDDSRHHGTKGGIIQQKHFKDMLLEGQDHDATLKVKEREFRAHKCVLRARSPVFAAMFTSNMKEAESGDVTIDDCDPNAFGEFLEYVYTGKIDNLTTSNASGLYYAGDKYDFPDLKRMCVEFLKTSLSLNVICDVIDMAMKHGEDELLDCAMAFFTDHVMEIWQTVEWQRFLKHNSALANELNLKAMASYHKNI